jgi:hypothetical protein
MKNTSKINKIFATVSRSLLTLSAFALAAGCGSGGGGDTSGPPPRSPYITVTSVTPVDTSADVDAQISEIKVTFSADIDPAKFIKEGSALMNLINAKKGSAFPNGSEITNFIDAATGAAVDIAKLKLEQIANGNYAIVGKYLSNVSGAVQLITGTIKIVAYQFVPEGDTGLQSLLLFVDNGAEPFTFSGADLIASGLVNSKMFLVEKISGTSGTVTPAQGQVTVSGRTVSFRPTNFLEWGSKYRITVKKDTGNTPETQGILELITTGSDSARTLEKNLEFTFTTKTLPKTQITATTPNGIDASPVGQIRATTNFKVDVSSLANNVILNRVIKTTNVPELNPLTNQMEVPFTLEQVPASVTYDAVQSQIIITPNGDLRYLQEYEVTINGGAGGIRGSMGAVTGRTLEELKFTWGFTTADAQVVSLGATNTVPTSDVGTPTTVKVKLNFKPDTATVQAGVKLMSISGNPAYVPYTYSINNDEITLKPTNGLKYGMTYSVDVTPELKSLPLRGTENQNGTEALIVSLMNTYTKTFSMDVRKIISHVPNSGLEMSETSSIVISTNFDIPDSIAADLSYVGRSVVTVTQSVSGQSGTSANVNIIRTAERVIEIKPNVAYPFGASVHVDVRFPQIEGSTIAAYSLDEKVAESKTLVVTSKTPYESTNVGLNTEISVSFSHMIKALTSDQTLSGYSSSALRVYRRSSPLYPGACASSGELSGRITYDKNRVYFIPTQALKSWCEYEVTVNRNIVAADGRIQPNDYSFKFSSNGLEVQNVYVTYAYENLVDINEPIEIVFNYDLDYFQWSDAVKLYDNVKRQYVSGSVSVWNNKLTFNPYSDLVYGTSYTLTVASGTWGAEGEQGETMARDYSVSFNTQNLPISVDNYGPIGTVRTDARFWIEFSRNVNTTGFPQIKGYLSGNEQFVSNDNLYTFGFKPSSNLSTGSNYNIRFDWIYDNGFRDDGSFSWSVNSSTTASAAGARMNLSFKGDRTKIFSALYQPSYLSAEEFADSCVTTKGCIGKLVSSKPGEYRQRTLRGQSKVDIAPKNSRILSR